MTRVLHFRGRPINEERIRELEAELESERTARREADVRRRFRVLLHPAGREVGETERPYVEWVGGPNPYVWIGDDENGCYATCEPKALERLARAVLAAQPVPDSEDD